METSLENYNGQNYHTAVLKRLLLYPQRAGKLTVNSGKYDVTLVQYETVNMGYFRTQRPVEVEVTTSSNVASLPGRASSRTSPCWLSPAPWANSLSRQVLTTSYCAPTEALYTYAIKGRGNIKFISEEPVVQFPAGIDTYTPKTEDRRKHRCRRRKT